MQELLVTTPPEYPVPPSGPVFRLGEPKRLPWRINERIARDDARLAEELQAMLMETPAWRARSAEVARLQERLRAEVPPRAWATYLDLEERELERLQIALVTVARRAFADGRRRRRP